MEYYDKDNYAKIPEVMNKESFVFKKFVFNKGAELRARE